MEQVGEHPGLWEQLVQRQGQNQEGARVRDHVGHPTERSRIRKF